MNIEYIKKNAEKSGKCGDNLTWWQLDSDLYIEGQGIIENGSFLCADKIRNVMIAPGCTGIDDAAFGICEIETVELPDGLEFISDHAFRECSSLVITVPDSVKKIGYDAFLYVREVIYNGPARPDPDDDNWGAHKWTWDPALRPRKLALRCAICGGINNDPLTTDTKESFDGVRIAAYRKAVHWDNQTPVPETEMDVTVFFPFCCTVGDSFWAIYQENQFVQAKLISVDEEYENSAEVRVLVLQIRSDWSFVEPVSEEEKTKLRDQHIYDYVPLGGFWYSPVPLESPQNILRLMNHLSSEIFYEDHIYTDEDGIDHLIICTHRDEENDIVFAGDKVLGFRKDSPLQWENGLFINHNENMVVWCRNDGKEVVVPDGITRLDWNGCRKLERITLPDSVTKIYNVFESNVKEVILIGDSKLTEKDFPENIKVIKKAHNK